MNSDTKEYRDSSDGESESSLLKLLQDIPDINGDHMVNTDKDLDWSDGGLLSESDTELEAALKVAAPSVRNKGDNTGSNSRITVKTKSKGDKSQPESAKSVSVLKVTEGLKICSITQTAYPAKKPKCVIPHKDGCRTGQQTRAGSAGHTGHAGHAGHAGRAGNEPK